MKRPRIAVDPSLLVGDNDDEILRHYVELVRTWRGANGRSALRLRQADVAVLVAILGTESGEIERRLIAATACTTAAARRSRRLLLASLGALSLSLTGTAVAGAMSRAQNASSFPGQGQVAAGSTADQAAPPSTTAPDGAPTDPAPTPTPVHEAQVTTAETPAAPAVLPGIEATVSIPSLSIGLPVIEGGQSVIDDGVVAHYVAAGWEEPVAAGAAGTYWLAAHHVTHGGPFNALPDIAVGAEIRVTTTGQTFVYTVTSKEVVGLLPGDAAVYGSDPTSSVILLQTCIDDSRRLLVHGILTATL